MNRQKEKKIGLFEHIHGKEADQELSSVTSKANSLLNFNPNGDLDEGL